jgi:hypothetical protein
MKMSIHKRQQECPFSLDSGSHSFYINRRKQHFSLFCGVGDAASAMGLSHRRKKKTDTEGSK